MPTPPETVDIMVDLLFRLRPPKPSSTILDPGCGTGEFIDGVIRWCRKRNLEIPHITGVELDSRHMPALKEKYKRLRSVRVEHTDFLNGEGTAYDYVIGNPPYVPITALSESEKARYRERHVSARGRFDLYLLFFEQALRQLAPNGRLVFITPEKYLYVETAAPLRDLLSRYHVEEINLVREDTFGELVTYPMITTVNNAQPGYTHVIQRDGKAANVTLPSGRDSWLPILSGGVVDDRAVTLGDLCVRLSCGVATGADGVFVRPAGELHSGLRSFAYPTIAGRELSAACAAPETRSVMLIPYDVDGRLIPLNQLGGLKLYLSRKDVRERLLARTCVRRKPWYAFHETPPLRDILRPKILCKDIGESPQFWVDRAGGIVPRHSVYYIVPREPEAVDEIADYLRSPSVNEWLARNCQRAAKGFLRLQSHVLQRLPVTGNLARLADNFVDSASDRSSQIGVPAIPRAARAA